MDYTKNHHLPQWEKSDRIMMDDFNQAMACIEAGFERAEIYSNDLWTRFLDRLSPMACDLYHAVMRHSDQTNFNSSWRELHFNAFSSDSAAYDRTGLNWNAGSLSLGAGSGWSTSQISAAIAGDGLGRYHPSTNYHTVASCSFVSPGCGVLTSIHSGIYADFNGNNIPSLTAQFKLTCQRKKNDQFVTVKECPPFSITYQATSVKNVELPVGLPLLGGAEYQLILDFYSCSNSNSTYMYGIINYPAKDFVPTAETSTPTQGSFRETVITPDQYERAIALVRYNGGSVAINLGGENMPLATTFDVTLEDGTSCKEAQFVLPGGPTGSLTAELIADCPNGSMFIYDCGFVFI